MAHVNDPPRDGCTCPEGWVGSHHWSCSGERKQACQHTTWTLYHDVQGERWFKRCRLCGVEIDIPRRDIVFDDEEGR